MPTRARQVERVTSVETADVKDLGRRIRQYRQATGLSQRALATRLGITSGAIGQWELGLKAPSTPRLAALGKALGVSLDILLGASQPTATPRPTNPPAVEDLRLIDEARRLGVDLRPIVAEARRRRWLEENRGALKDANSFLNRHGLWSDGRRQF